jgi:hypothetical protein
MSVVSTGPWPVWLLQATAPSDTVVIAVPTAQGWTGAVISISQLIVSIAVLILLVAIVLMLIALRKGVFELTKLFQSSYGDVSAAAHSVRNAADDVRGITSSVRGEIEAVTDTVRTVNAGVRETMHRAEQRLKRLDALVEVAQDEAEDFIVSSAATLRGLRFGAAALRRGFALARRNGTHRVRKRRRRDDALEPRRREEVRDERPRIRHRVREER